MKASGIGIVATYLFWISHEEIEGEFDFTGDRDLRAFINNGCMTKVRAWCPPECAFEAADEVGICLLVEMPLWINKDVTTLEYGDDPSDTRCVLSTRGTHGLENIRQSSELYHVLKRKRNDR